MDLSQNQAKHQELIQHKDHEEVNNIFVTAIEEYFAKEYKEHMCFDDALVYDNKDAGE